MVTGPNALGARIRVTTKRALGSLPARPFGRSGRDELLVVYFHETPSRHLDRFRRQVRSLCDAAVALAPDRLDAYFAGELRDGPYVMFTFDDGFATNLGAAGILEEHGTRGLFFAVPEFVEAGREHAESFVRRHIRREPAPGQFQGEDEWRAATWDELRDLRARGHEVGSHSLHHWFSASDLSDTAAHEEIVGSRDALATGLGCETADIRCFAAPISVARSVGARELELARVTYRYVFSTYAGSNRMRDRLLVHRANVEAGWSDQLVRYSTRALTAPRGWRRTRRYVDSIGPA
jgi:peptidoglycan/xylan/chitin deacetylase (PgdA/CDA1 family)